LGFEEGAAMVETRPLPLTQPIRLATFAVLVQSLVWSITSILLFCDVFPVDDLSRVVILIDLGDPVSDGIINLTVAIILLWLQFRTVFLRRKWAGILAGGVWIVWGILNCLPMEWHWYELVVAAGWVFVGCITVRWGWRMDRHAKR